MLCQSSQHCVTKANGIVEDGPRSSTSGWSARRPPFPFLVSLARQDGGRLFVCSCGRKTPSALLGAQCNLQSTGCLRPHIEWPSNCSPRRAYIHPEPPPCPQHIRSSPPPPSPSNHLPIPTLPDTPHKSYQRCLPLLHPRPPRALPSSVSSTARRLPHTTLTSRRNSRSPLPSSPTHPGRPACPSRRRRTRSTTFSVHRAPRAHAVRARAVLATRA